MEEEKFGKTAKTTYLICYSIFLAVGLLFSVLGAVVLFTGPDNSNELPVFAYFFLVFGIVLTLMSIGWLIYFITLPQYAITYKNGKLIFRNKIECTPVQLESVQAKGGGLDGALFNFGRIIYFVNGKKYKLGFIHDANAVVKKLYEIKARYEVLQNIEKKKAENAEVQTGDING